MFSLKHFSLWLILACAAGAPLSAQPYATGPVDAGEVEAELVSTVAAIVPGQRFEVALRMEMTPHWHVYWINPGDTGLAPQVEWRLPEGFEAGPLQFPYPQLIPTPPLVSYGYEGELFLIAEVVAPDNLEPGSSVRLEAATNWLVCADVCIPGEASIALELPVVADAAESSPGPYAEAIDATRRQLPFQPERSGMAVEALADDLVITLAWEGFEGAELESPYFFIEQEAIVDSAAEQTFDLQGNQLRVAVRKSDYFDESVESFSGVLYASNGFAAADGRQAVAFDAQESGLEVVLPGQGSGLLYGFPRLGMAQALLYAFLGGLILNLMPCVFPVLSVKALGFVQQAGEDRGRILRHGLVFTGGVLASFWLLAGALIALRSAGERLGWGFQLQHPLFVAGLLVVMFLFGLSLAGVFELGASAISLAGRVKSQGYTGSFLSGVLATVVATPCTGPFMGPALGFALTLSAAQGLAIFTLLGLGMATPYLTLSASPPLIAKLPRPGPWMETFKQLMAFPMFATCIWLVWILAGERGLSGGEVRNRLLWVLAGLLIVALGAWIYGRWSGPLRSRATRRLAAFCALLAVASGAWLMAPRAAAAEGIDWQPYSPELVAQLQQEGKPYFIDFTADWCLTCKANELRAFSSEEVAQRLREWGVAMIKADWTHYDSQITEALESYGRSGVPLYIAYSGESGEEPRILPQLLNPKLVLDTLDPRR